MNPEDSSDSDAPLDELVRAEIKRQDDYYKWVEQNAREALGKNHRAEMAVNFGIARNKRRQRQEEYAAVVKELKKPTTTNGISRQNNKEVKNGEKRRKVHTKQEAESRYLIIGTINDYELYALYSVMTRSKLNKRSKNLKRQKNDRERRVRLLK